MAKEWTRINSSIHAEIQLRRNTEYAPYLYTEQDEQGKKLAP
jgi:hypothetical protein